MVRESLKQADALRRKQYVPESERTTERDQLADWLTKEFVDGNRDWDDATIQGLSDETGWSREHIATVLDSYFDPAGGPSSVIHEVTMAAVDHEASGDTFADGFEAGFVAGLSFAIEHDLFSEETESAATDGGIPPSILDDYQL